MSDERLRHQLEMQSLQIQEVFTRHETPAQVGGGSTTTAGASFILREQLALGKELLGRLTSDLMATLKVPRVNVYRENGRWRIDVPQEEAPPVALLDVLAMLPPLPAVTAVLGWAEEERPLLLNLRKEGLSHILIAGDVAAGKTALLRTIAVSLAQLNRQAQLQLVVIDPELPVEEAGALDLQPLNYLPHLLSPVLGRVEDAAEALAFLADELAYRQTQEVRQPAIVVMIDNLANLLRDGGQPVLAPLTRLAQEGAGAGIHLVLATREPETRRLDSLLRACLPVRLVGWLADETAGRAASGVPNCRAEYLLGKGDFQAVVRGKAIHFQAAFLNRYDLTHCLELIHRRSNPVLLAQQLTARSQRLQPPQKGMEEAPDDLPFVVDQRGRLLLLDEPLQEALPEETPLDEQDTVEEPPRRPAPGVRPRATASAKTPRGGNNGF